MVSFQSPDDVYTQFWPTLASIFFIVVLPTQVRYVSTQVPVLPLISRLSHGVATVGQRLTHVSSWLHADKWRISCTADCFTYIVHLSFLDMLCIFQQCTHPLCAVLPHVVTSFHVQRPLSLLRFLNLRQSDESSAPASGLPESQQPPPPLLHLLVDHHPCRLLRTDLSFSFILCTSSLRAASA